MQVVLAEQKKRVLKVLEVAIQVGTPLQIGRLWGIGEQMARGHEEEQSRKKGRTATGVNGCRPKTLNRKGFAPIPCETGALAKYYACILERRASCNTCEKFIPIETAQSFSHDGMVNVFFTAFVSLYWLISQDTREEKPSSV